jgi:hypothetical protein
MSLLVTICPIAPLGLPHAVPVAGYLAKLRLRFGELVVTGRRQMTARADCGRTPARSHGHFDTLLVGTEVGLQVDKTSETIAAV